MKNLFIIGAFVTGFSLCGPSSAQAANRLLNLMPACQDFTTVKTVAETDYKSKMALSKADAALGNIKTFDQTCSNTAGDSSYNSDVQINKLVSQSKMATETAAKAVYALEEAIEYSTPIGNSLGAVGVRKDCEDQAKAIPVTLKTKKKDVESAMKKLESCVSRASVSTSTPTSSSTKKFLQRCMLVPNPQPGVNCKEDEMNDGETARGGDSSQ